MSSGYTPKWKRILIRVIPTLFKKCDGGNYHWKFDRLCFCQYNENGNKIMDMKTRKQYDFYDGWHPYESKMENSIYSAPVEGEIK